MRKKFKIELFAEIEIDCNQLLQESDILELASPKVIIKNYCENQDDASALNESQIFCKDQDLQLSLKAILKEAQIVWLAKMSSIVSHGSDFDVDLVGKI